MATLQGSTGNNAYVAWAKRTSKTTLKIALNKAVAAKVAVAWFVIG